MKKLFAVLLALVFMISCISVATAETVVSYTYDEETTEIEEVFEEEIEEFQDEVIPESAPEELLSDEVIPQAAPAVLPQTGGIPVEAFYGLGAMFILAAIVISMKKAKVTQSK